jgi:broad specificity phosphatase PhoE
MTTILLIPHVDAGDRGAWPGVHDMRPLSDLGRHQAEALAQALANRSFSALYASPALRARQTLEPLAVATGLTLKTLPAIAEKQPSEDRPAMARRAWEAFKQIAAEHPDATVAAASHGDLIPALADYLASEHHAGGVPDITRRGQWYEIEISADNVSILLNDGTEDFPLE